MEEITKVCKGCGKKLPITKFYKNSATKDGHDGKCVECRKKQTAIWAAKHPKKKAAATKSKPRKKTTKVPTSHPDVLPFVAAMPASAVNLAGMTDKELFDEIRKRGYTGELRYSTVISV